MAKIKYIGEEHELFIEQGRLNRSRLRSAIERAINKSTKRDFYIFSPPGLGKSYTTEQVFAQYGITPAVIKGNNSLFGFVTDMALIMQARELNDPNGHVFLFIDDCDNLLLHSDSVNTLKIALNDRKLNYNKTLGAQYNQLEEHERAAIDHYRVEGRIGVTIPLDNVTIIWCSNYKLADQTNTAAATTDKARQKCRDEEALRRRLNARDYDVSDMILWGWIADCVLNETPTSMQSADREELEYILSWMKQNWTNLKEHNITFAEKLYEEMQLDPDSYLTAWEFDYLVN